MDARGPGLRGLALALTALFVALPGHAESERVEVETAPLAGYQENQPPPGTWSLFDQLIMHHGGVPYPFADLIDLVAEFSADQSPPVALLVPDGRPLVRSRGSYHRPRSLIAAAAPQPAMDDDSFGLLLRNRLFVGLVEQIDQLEVVSYNEGAGRFEFQLVDDCRDGGEMRISYASRDLCMACHQGGIPIFSVRPWQETNANPAVVEQLVAAMGGDDYHGVPLRQELSVAERFDTLTDNAAALCSGSRLPLPGIRGCSTATRRTTGG